MQLYQGGEGTRGLGHCWTLYINSDVTSVSLTEGIGPGTGVVQYCVSSVSVVDLSNI